MTTHALCRRVADGWLILDVGPFQTMQQDLDRIESRETVDEDHYRVIATECGLYEIIDLNGNSVAENEFVEFCRDRAAEPRKWTPPKLPKQRQLALLTHLDDLGGQETFDGMD